jgi:hypothetical protein
MSWQQWLSRGDLKPHRTSKQELDNMRTLIARDLADAAIQALSEDRRFATAYNAALQSGTMAIACSGYRVSARAGHHAVTFEAAAFAMGKAAAPFADYFDTCRRKRNVIDYLYASVATETEADELLMKAREFNGLVENWITANFPAVSR